MLKCRFPEKKPTAIDAALDLMRWTDELLKAGYPSARKGTPAAYDPMSTVAIYLTDEDLRLIVTETDVARTKKLRPKLEAIVGSQRDARLSVHEWGRLVCSLCGARQGARVRRPAMTLAGRIARSLAEAVGLEEPSLKK